MNSMTHFELFDNNIKKRKKPPSKASGKLEQALRLKLINLQNNKKKESKKK